MSAPERAVKFPLGQIVATPNALSRLTPEDVLKALARHAAGDWGDVCPEDWEANERALKEGTRLLSAYRSAAGEKFWVITEAFPRSATTILMPEDY